MISLIKILSIFFYEKEFTIFVKKQIINMDLFSVNNYYVPNFIYSKKNFILSFYYKKIKYEEFNVAPD